MILNHSSIIPDDRTGRGGCSGLDAHAAVPPTELHVLDESCVGDGDAAPAPAYAAFQDHCTHKDKVGRVGKCNAWACTLVSRVIGTVLLGYIIHNIRNGHSYCIVCPANKDKVHAETE